LDTVTSFCKIDQILTSWYVDNWDATEYFEFTIEYDKLIARMNVIYLAHLDIQNISSASHSIMIQVSWPLVFYAQSRKTTHLYVLQKYECILNLSCIMTNFMNSDLQHTIRNAWQLFFLLFQFSFFDERVYILTGSMLK
jgi:hypothetical protein